MKFDPFNWQEVKHEVEIQSGRVQVSCSAPSALYAEAQGVETLVGFGTAWDLDLSAPVTLRLDGPPTARLFVALQYLVVDQPDAEMFTNIDQMPLESGSVLEVTRALRMMEINKRQTMAEMRELHAELMAQRGEAASEPELVVIEDDLVIEEKPE